MTYKNIFLSTFLVPFTILSDSNVDARIQELKKAQHEKEQELSIIIKMIDEKEIIIDSMISKARTVSPHITAQLDDEETEELRAGIKSFQINLQQALINQKTIEDFFNTDLFNKDVLNTENAFELKRIQYLFIRYTVEYAYLKRLIEQYGKCLQESLEIGWKLDKIQK